MKNHTLAEKRLPYPIILLDWGNTVMRDDPAITTPMVEWERIEVIEGIAEVLAYLHSSGRRIVLATSASISDERQIHGALARGGLDIYFSGIYCFKNTNLPKGEAFYHHILNDLNIPAADALMVSRRMSRSRICWGCLLYGSIQDRMSWIRVIYILLFTRCRNYGNSLRRWI